MTRQLPALPKWTWIICLLVAALLISTACSMTAAATQAPTVVPTKEVKVENVQPTKAPTNTKAPTPTVLPTDTPAPTATPRPTSTPDLTATADAENAAALAGAKDQFLSDLGKIKIVPEGGSLVYYSSEARDIHLTEYGQSNYDLVDKNLQESNFIFKTDVTWDSKTGLATCGLIFWADKDIENGDYYVFQALRLSGLPGWDIEFYSGGHFDYNVVGHILTTNKIKQESGSTNTYIVIGKGTNVQLFANGTRIAMTDNTKKNKGYLAYFGSQESGDTTCSFSNTYVWELPDGK